MLITTTPTIDGVAIDEYIKPVSSHVVLGVDLFADIAASWRDVFGGRSKSYQQQLERLTDLALQELEKTAKSLKANAIIGLSLDYSDISGGGKSTMFMVVATGTAVRTKGDVVQSKQNNNQLLDNETVEFLVLQHAAINEFKAQSHVTEGAIRQLTERKCHQVWSDVLTKIGQNIPSYEPVVSEYFKMCAEEKGYRWTLETTLGATENVVRNAGVACLNLAPEFRFSDLLPFDFNKANPLSLVSLAQCRQLYYKKEDIGIINSLIDSISDSFPIVFVTKEEKSFTGKIKQQTYCPCGAKIEILSAPCHQCHQNKWGMPSRHDTPDTAIENLTVIRNALMDSFGQL